MRFLLSFLVLFSLVSNCKKDYYTVASGVSTGTYTQFAKSLEILEGVKLKILKTHGSQENVEAVRDGKADIAFTQIDNFENLCMTDEDIRKEVKIVLPLYSEELHLLTTAEIKSLKDLKGKSISIGPRKSGIEGTAWGFFTIMGLDVSSFQIKQGSSEDALTDLENQKIDAMFIVAGAPVRLLSSLIPEKAKNIKIYSFNNRERLKMLDSAYQYQKATISPNVYPWNKQLVKTVSVDSIIVASEDTDPEFIKKLLKDIFKNQETLRKAHSKWAEVSILKTRSVTRKLAGQMHTGTLAYLKEL